MAAEPGRWADERYRPPADEASQARSMSNTPYGPAGRGQLDLDALVELAVEVLAELRTAARERELEHPSGQSSCNIEQADLANASSCRRRLPQIKVRFGTVLSGEKLVDNLGFRENLKELEPEAIGGEMEGTGVFAACHERVAHWLVVKAICDWGDGNKAEDKDDRQKLAAKNAATLVFTALQRGGFAR